MLEAVSSRDYPSAATLARKNLDELPALVRSTEREYGSFDLQGIPGLEQGGTMLALAGDRQALTKMKRIVESLPELAPWKNEPDRHLENLDLFAKISSSIDSNPGCLQSSVKEIVGIDDGRRLANLISWLEKAGRIRRVRQGSSYALYMANAAEAPAPQPPRTVRSHRVDRSPLRLAEIETTRLPLVPLPRAPLRWEEAVQGRVATAAEIPEEAFELREAPAWRITAIEKIPTGERPDPAFRKFHSIDRGLLLLDDLGKAVAFPNASASAVRYGPHGEIRASAALLHDAYRVSTNPLGNGLIALSRECVLHAYDPDLRPFIETAMAGDLEVERLCKRLDLDRTRLKNCLRSVALSCDSSRYIVSGVDEAWCLTADGRGIWGLKFPIKEEWRPVSGDSANFGTSDEISQALVVMGLQLPFSQDEFKSRYRELARRWHPDLNPRDPTSEERMKALTGAAELLTGLDAAALSAYTGTKYEKRLGQTSFQVGDHNVSVSFSMQVSELHAADWINAAAFAGRSNEAFLASASGQIVLVSADGDPLRVFQTGTAPHRIADTGDFLYFLTDTRLYVLRGETLHAVVDTSDGGDLIIAQRGIGLLEKNRFRWLNEDGSYVGAVLSRDPIRRVYWTPSGLVVESRQKRATIAGPVSWWD
ncbi:MAG TPA: DnaJ domain-containing protein [Thermoanaerobaculia bacterium]|nr:DnaJ domain-containing protein [Thermoanaerobaculia bacterium]